MIAYYSASGKYVWVGTATIPVEGAPPPPPHPLHTTHGLYVGVVDQFTQYHDTGSDTPKMIPPKPSDFHTFDYAGKQWHDERTLQDLKLAKNEEINAARLTANQTSFNYQGQRIAVDSLSRGDIETTHGVILLTGAMPPTWVGGWKTVANTYVPIPDVATWAEFYLAMNSQGSRNFAHAQALKAKLALATTPAQVEAVVWGSEV